MIADSDEELDDSAQAKEDNVPHQSTPNTAPIQRDYEIVDVPQYLPSVLLPALATFKLPACTVGDEAEQCAAIPEFGVHRGNTFTRKYYGCCIRCYDTS